jgi:hypothetical protein|nr:MAG TPA: hypothetical protein [Caudoviricetes sp.]
MNKEKLLKFVRTIQKKTYAKDHMAPLIILEHGILDLMHLLEDKEQDTQQLATRVLTAVYNYNGYYGKPNPDTSFIKTKADSEAINLPFLLETLGIQDNCKDSFIAFLTAVIVYTAVFRLDDKIIPKENLIQFYEDLIDKEGLQFIVSDRVVKDLKPGVTALEAMSKTIGGIIHPAIINALRSLEQNVRNNTKASMVIPSYGYFTKTGIEILYVTDALLEQAGFRRKDEE